MNGKIFTVYLSAIIILLPTMSLAKDIQRSCSAYYEIERTSSVTPPPPPPSVGVETISASFGHFSTKGSCRSRARANTCRERAREVAHRCMSAHWALGMATGDIGAVPCSGGSVTNYPISDQSLQRVLRDWICGTFRAKEMTVRVRTVTTGDKGCPKTTVLSNNFRARCNR